MESERILRTKNKGLKRIKYGNLWQIWSSHSSTDDYSGLQIGDTVLLVTVWPRSLGHDDPPAMQELLDK